MQNSMSMNLLTDGQHSFNDSSISQGDFANESGNLDFRSRQNCVFGVSVRVNQLNGAIARNSTRGGRDFGHQNNMACLK